MQEEFHGNGLSGADWKGKLLYGWGALNTNVWLPSLSELVGTDPNHYYEPHGTYFSAMQGMNTSIYYYTDAQGGEQFAYFQQFNASGGGETIWNACKQEQSWLRSSYAAVSQYSWIISGLNLFNAYSAFPLTASHAVHPAAGCGTRPFYSAHRKTAPAFAGAIFLSTRFV